MKLITTVYDARVTWCQILSLWCWDWIRLRWGGWEAHWALEYRYVTLQPKYVISNGLKIIKLYTQNPQSGYKNVSEIFVLYFSLYPCLNCPNTIIACHSRTLRDSRTGVLKKDFQQTFPSIHKYCPILPISISFETTTTLTTTSTRWQTLLTQKLNFSDFPVQNTMTLFVF